MAWGSFEPPRRDGKERTGGITWLRCYTESALCFSMQYYVGNATAGPSSQIRSVEPMAEVSPVDDNDFLVGHCGTKF